MLTVEQQVLDRALGDGSPLRWNLVAPILPAARASYFVLHRSPVADPLSAVTDDFVQLVSRLGLDTRPIRREYLGQVRGTIDWAATVRARSADQQNPLRFVCREAERQTNTPQNQVLVFVLARMAEAIQQIPPTLRHGQVRSGMPTPDLDFVTIDDQVTVMETAVRTLRMNPRLRSVTAPTMLEQQHLDAALRTGHPAYELAVALYERWYDMVEQPTADALHDCGRHSILLPAAGQPNTDAWIELAAFQLRARLS